VLDALLADVDLDFLVLFSSVSALTAPAGQVDYVGASAFLDAYARSAKGSGRRRVVSVNWGIWSGVGMAANALGAAVAPIPASPDGRKPQHPLFDSRGGDPDAPLRLEARYEPKIHWLLTSTAPSGRAVVPGSAYPELARAAPVEAGRALSEIHDLLFLRPPGRGRRIAHGGWSRADSLGHGQRPQPGGCVERIGRDPEIRDARRAHRCAASLRNHLPCRWRRSSRGVLRRSARTAIPGASRTIACALALLEDPEGGPRRAERGPGDTRSCTDSPPT
jgi:hypothetical protein